MENLKKEIKAIAVKIKTGMHIGSGNDDIQIGGVDSAVIKDPLTKLPIIPGSSLKGKLRFLLETDVDNKNGELDEDINLVFGATMEFLKSKKKKNKDKEKNNEFRETPTRILIRDLFLEKDKANGVEHSDFEKMSKGEISTEFKSEIKMNRGTGKVDSFGPRTIERVPAGLNFTGEIVIRYQDEDEKGKIVKMLTKSFNLLKMDALGGSGSRGYGQVEISFK
jgi:CRISPR-associated protein Csm3